MLLLIPLGRIYNRPSTATTRRFTHLFLYASTNQLAIGFPLIEIILIQNKVSGTTIHHWVCPVVRKNCIPMPSVCLQEKSFIIYKQWSSLTIATYVKQETCLSAFWQCKINVSFFSARCLFWKANAPIDIRHASLTNDALSVKTLQFLFVHHPVTHTTTSGNTHMNRKSIIFPQLQNLCAATANTSVKCSVWRVLVCGGVPEDSRQKLMKDTWAYMSECWFDKG